MVKRLSVVGLHACVLGLFLRREFSALKELEPTSGDLKRRVHPHFILGDVLGQLLVVDLLAGVVREPAMHDGVEPGIHHHPHRFVRAAMRNDHPIASMALFTYSLKLFH